MQQPSTPQQSSKIYPLLATALGMLLLTGCNKADFNALIAKTQNSDAQYCQAQATPFNHTLCRVSQDSLQQADSGLSLRLFWKSGQMHTASASSDVAATGETSSVSSDSLNNSSKQDVSLPDLDQSREPLYTFDALLADLPERSQLQFAVNAGMYDSEFAPIGYTVMQGQQVLSLNLNQGAGNFHLLPNGVLWWNKDSQVQITESKQFAKMLDSQQITPWYATQSGPMLVIDNQLHPKFNQNSTSKKIRNGVGVCADGQIKFVTAQEPVNFYQFASYFQQQLHCPNALFLDGGIASALYAPELDYKDDKNMGVMLGLVEDSTD
ncbi:phosphodiester glycosidase family protein [Psychrobacter lutiphocae]|uniref:phosphodiester glycosidase family protein n=1 Tax=Psychrobacter lutiphocae TaxID=540500 RepID=UPI0003706CCB|nr:phosphodiester glycosidase family protein [Psychrobacter lutiphocae]